MSLLEIRLRGVAAFLCAFVFGAIVATPARATIVEALAIAEMVERAHAVVQGRVIQVESRMSPDGSQITTLVRIRLFRSLKKDPGRSGPAPRYVDLAFEGGTAQGITMRISGTPAFERGDKVLVFLFRNEGESAYRPLALAYGCFDCRHDLARARTMGARDLTGLEVVKIAPDGRVEPVDCCPPAPLDSLVDEIEAALAR